MSFQRTKNGGVIHYEKREIGGNELVALNYDRLIESRETKLSWCFDFGGEIHYLPKSQVEDIRETAKEVDVPRWLVERKGLEEFGV